MFARSLAGWPLGNEISGQALSRIHKYTPITEPERPAVCIHYSRAVTCYVRLLQDIQ
jgi:hypothetical protein